MKIMVGNSSVQAPPFPSNECLVFRPYFTLLLPIRLMMKAVPFALLCRGHAGALLVQHHAGCLCSAAWFSPQAGSRGGVVLAADCVFSFKIWPQGTGEGVGVEG